MIELVHIYTHKSYSVVCKGVADGAVWEQSTPSKVLRTILSVNFLPNSSSPRYLLECWEKSRISAVLVEDGLDEEGLTEEEAGGASTSFVCDGALDSLRFFQSSYKRP